MKLAVARSIIVLAVLALIGFYWFLLGWHGLITLVVIVSSALLVTWAIVTVVES